MDSFTYASPRSVSALLGTMLRANPQYEIVPLDHLPDATMLATAMATSEIYGILNPKGESEGGNAPLSVRVASCDTALLFLTLQKPGLIPAYLRDRFTVDLAGDIIRLILDTVLEIRSDTGMWISGAAALREMLSASPSKLLLETTEGTIAGLSRNALVYAQELPIQDARILARRLYQYNHLPCSQRWKELLPTRESVTRFLEIPTLSPDDSSQRLVNFWRYNEPDSDDWWHYFHNEGYEGPSNAPEWMYKLYISPSVEVVPDALKAVLKVLPQHNAIACKVGLDLQGLLRPDKMVSYFSSQEEMHSAAANLCEVLEGYPVHGVPFTAELAGAGLLSWGMDPPSGSDISDSHGVSWRSWVTNRLASALLIARATDTVGANVMAPWAFALERIRLEGIDTATWSPSEKTWQQYL